ncbi:uncharacterized protein LOC129586075 [Paramacrobiotus metropolitanus]|uniref:uncharacterized protein LOC129586075 n=1 Tax=Paramacrobiotus metropolitanus TaxID=2943436 RepID=UPI00244584C5|nr:uncharacterized protein LOC129586075 [Paramacrobiotus metropolitanus]
MAIRTTVGKLLDRNRVWAYQEIMAEALVVLWFALHIAVKFGTRFFPEWSNTRVDPDFRTGLDIVLRWFGYKMNGCAWDHVVAPWMARSIYTFNGSDIVPTTAASDIRGHLGYAGTLAIVCATSLLTISVGCCLFANRHWKYPLWTQHFHRCEHIRAFIVRKVRSDSWKCHKLTTALLTVGLMVFSGFCAALTCVCFFIWLALWALPVVLMCGAAVGLTIHAVGSEAVLPCCVLSVCILCVHCTGRIWGLWMKETYFSRINNTFRRMCGAPLVLEASSVKCAPVPAVHLENLHQPKTLKALREERKDATIPILNVKLCVFFVCCLAVSADIDTIREEIPLANVSARAKDFWDRSIFFGYKRDCYPIGLTGLQHSEAMLSYWMDLGYPRWNTSQPALLSLYESTFFSDLYIFLRVWIVLLSYIVCAPMLYIIIRFIRWLHKRWHARRVLDSAPVPTEAEEEPTEPPHDLAADGCPAAAVDDEQSGPDDTSSCTPIVMENTVAEPSDIAPCMCPFWVSIVAFLVITNRRYLCWRALPYPLVQLFIPEPLQLWVLLLLLTTYGVWIIWKFAVEVHQIRQERQTLIPSSVHEKQGSIRVFPRFLE